MSSPETASHNPMDNGKPNQMPNGKKSILSTCETALYGALAKVKGIAKKSNLPTPVVSIPLLGPSPADTLDKLSRAPSIDDRQNAVQKIMEDYMRSSQSSQAKDGAKLNAAAIKLCSVHPINGDNEDDNAFCQAVISSLAEPEFPDAENVYERLLRASDTMAHPNDVSGMAFAVATILALSLYREADPHSRSEHNGTSPYLDLSPLYGVDETDTDKIRMKDGRGMLSPDCFCEDRLDMLPDSVPALLVLWNRYHNYVAMRLLLYNEKNEWVDPSNVEHEVERPEIQDDEIFNLARSLTCIHFMNVIRGDFLKGLFGLPSVGRNIQLDILHDAMGSKGKNNSLGKGYHSTVESYMLYDFWSLAPESDEVREQPKGETVDPDLRRRNYMGLNRNKKGYFDDNDLASILFNATESVCGAPRPNAIPGRMHDLEIKKIEQAREWKTCTLNEYRKHLGLKPLKSFQEWTSNGETAEAARDMYGGNIDRLELYPGLQAEQSMKGSGLSFGYTMTYSLIVDIVSKIRSDPRFAQHFDEGSLTKWGFEDCAMWPNHSDGSFNATLPKLLQRTLPHRYTYDNVYGLFPFSVPPASKQSVKKMVPGDNLVKKYTFDRPIESNVKVLRTIKAISEVFNRPKEFPSPYKTDLLELTEGYGYLLGFDDLTLHDRDLMLVLFSLLPDMGAATRIGAAFAQLAQANVVQRSVINDKGNRATIDIVRDVIDATCTRWVCETLYDLEFADNDMRRKVTAKDKAEARKQEIENHEDFAALHAYVFRNSEAELGWDIRERAINASKRLKEHVQKKLPVDDTPSDAHFGNYTYSMVKWLMKFTAQLREEYSSSGKKLPRNSAQTFLDRMMKASKSRPLGKLAANHPHLRHLQDKLRNQNIDPDDLSNHLEMQRVIANVIGLAVVISVHYSKVCAQAVEFYLDDKYKQERTKIINLCNSGNATNKQIMGYIQEAQRIGQRFGLWRGVALSEGEEVLVDQGHGYPPVLIKPGDRVFADFSAAHRNPYDFPDPDVVNPNRGTISLQGLGVHKCPGVPFIDQTMPELFKAIFKLEGLRRASKHGHLKSSTLHPDSAPWDTEVFLGEDGDFSYYPRQLVLDFDATGLKEKKEQSDDADKWTFQENKKVDKLRHTVDRGCTAITIVLLTLLLLYVFPFFSLPSLPLPSWGSKGPGSTQTNAECAGPLKDVVPWSVGAFRPKWFGLFGPPTSLTYRTRGRKTHKFSVVDIDRRDVQLTMWIDDEYHGRARDVEIDPTVECGEDVNKCLSLDFSAGLIVVPPGRHTVKIEIERKKDEKFKWGKERQRRVMWTVQRCA
ncbi:hypothetical protein AX17_007298 [Amanita inopinata Kibby_2008]|nr:hypothetical protein AX17_007298 [Amanita inopinata Kibby_2008]